MALWDLVNAICAYSQNNRHAAGENRIQNKQSEIVSQFRNALGPPTFSVTSQHC